MFVNSTGFVKVEINGLVPIILIMKYTTSLQNSFVANVSDSGCTKINKYFLRVWVLWLFFKLIFFSSKCWDFGVEVDQNV